MAYEAKTKKTEASVDSYLDAIADKSVKEDCKTLIHLMQKVSGHPPKMWGASIIGFGSYHYKYDSGHEGDICIVGFSPRKQNLTLYVLAGAPGQTDLLQKLGKHKAGKGCLYIKRLEDIDMDVLETLTVKAIDHLKKKFGKKQSQ
jgi:hypothetical protein